MAYPHVNQTTAQVVTAITGVAGTSANADAVNNALSGLATGTPTPIGTPVLMWNVLVVCTTGYGNAIPAVAPVFSYDITTIQ